LHPGKYRKPPARVKAQYAPPAETKADSAIRARHPFRSSGNHADPRVVGLLLDSGAEVNLSNWGDGSTPLDHTLTARAPCVELLKRRGGRTTRPVVDWQQMLAQDIMPRIKEAIDRHNEDAGPDS